jgi:hypothetical protein
MMIRSLVVGLAWGFAGICLSQAAGQDSARQPAHATDLFADENLTAWLVMFTDPVRRTPHERAAMLQRLGLGRVGFEAFDRYVPLLEQQMEAYGRQGIEVTCVYVVINTDTPFTGSCGENHSGCSSSAAGHARHLGDVPSECVCEHSR